MTQRLARDGFSLIEALVVLAVSGMALAIIFSIGVKAGDSGFALGRRAMSAADRDVAIEDTRSIIRSIDVRPARTFLSGVDRPFVGTPERFEGDAVMERATSCGPAGWAGRLVLVVEQEATGRALVCRAGALKTVLLRTSHLGATLSYSNDGRLWMTSLTNLPADGAGFRDLTAATLYVRFNGGPGTDVLDVAFSGRPESWTRRVDGI